MPLETENPTNTPPPPIVVLQNRLRDPEEVIRTHEHIKRHHIPTYPERSAAPFIHFMLWLSGIAMPYVQTVDQLLVSAHQHGWRSLKENGHPKPGDIYFLGIPNEYPVSCGFIQKIPALRCPYLLGINAFCEDGKARKIFIEGNEHQYPVLHILTAQGG
jgi:hypothetical protein